MQLTNTWEEIPSNYITAWNRARDAGVVRWVQGTAPPIATSTDAWMTLENQTTRSDFATRGQGFNAWLRDGAPMRDGVAVPPGTSGADVGRADYISLDGTIKKGSGSHLLGSGWVSETGGAIESSVGSGKYVIGIPNRPNDPIHYIQAHHDIQAKVLERDLKMMGY